MNAGRSDRLFSALQRCLPTRALSTLVFRLTQIRTIWFKNALIRLFQRHYAIDLGDAEHPHPEDYPSFNAFFTRALKPGARPLPQDPALLVSPVDGTVSQCASICGGRLIQAKGHDYSAQELLGGEAELTARFNGGSFCTLYLAPHNYHRIHMPVDGRLVAWRHVSGRLFSVNPATARTMPNLFARNERLVAEFETESGPLVLVLVGALFVGGLETVWAGQVSPPHRRGTEIAHYRLIQPLTFARGAELGRFNMGSTVILLAAPSALAWLPDCVSGRRMSMGQALARRTLHQMPHKPA